MTVSRYTWGNLLMIPSTLLRDQTMCHFLSIIYPERGLRIIHIKIAEVVVHDVANSFDINKSGFTFTHVLMLFEPDEFESKKVVNTKYFEAVKLHVVCSQVIHPQTLLRQSPTRLPNQCPIHSSTHSLKPCHLIPLRLAPLTYRAVRYISHHPQVLVIRSSHFPDHC